MDDDQGGLGGGGVFARQGKIEPQAWRVSLLQICLLESKHTPKISAEDLQVTGVGRHDALASPELSNDEELLGIPENNQANRKV